MRRPKPFRLSNVKVYFNYHLFNIMNNIKIKFNVLTSWLTYLLFFLISYTFLAFFSVHLFYFQEKNILFVYSLDYFLENIHQPGGLLVYFARFLTQLYYHPAIGAFIVSTIIAGTVFFTTTIFKILSGRNLLFLPLIIGLGMFYLQANYMLSLTYILGLMLQIALFWKSIRFLKLLNGWIPVAFIPLWYLASGGFSWLFSIMLLIYVIFTKDKGWLLKSVAIIIFNFVTFYISAYYIFFQSLNTLLLFPFNNAEAGLNHIVFFTIAGIMALLPVLGRINTPKIKFFESKIGVGVQTGFLTIVAIIICYVSYDQKTNEYYHSEKLFTEANYEAVVNYNLTHPSFNTLNIFLNNVALSETGKLNDLLFSFPQKGDGSTLFLKWEMFGEVLRRGAYFYFTTGMINEAQRWAFENMVMKGHTPEGLKMLIKTNLINGNYELAAKYIHLLSNTLYYKDIANNYEKLLFNEKAIDSNPELGNKKKLLIKSDFFTITDNPVVNLERALVSDSLNKQVINYNFAYLLVKKDLKGIVTLLPLLEKSGFSGIPIHIEEAILEYQILNLGPMPVFTRLKISSETTNRWANFLITLKQYNNDLRLAEPALRKNFRNSFWYYALYSGK